MKTTAAILVQTGQPLELTELEIPKLASGQALIEIEYSGVCHTQLLEARGYRGEDRFVPHCLGHEGVGKVVEIGPDVSRVKPGQRVILSWIKGPGLNVPGCTYDWNGRKVNAGAVTTFSQHAVISENRLTPLTDAVRPADAAMIGCAVPTGVGVVINTLEARPGMSLAVFGTGGVGLCAILGARLAGCEPIVAVDINPLRLAAARKAGATHCFDSRDGKVGEQLKALLPAGLDLAVEASGRPDVMVQALTAVRPQGGIAAIVGNARHGEAVQIDPLQFNLGKQLRGSWGGECRPEIDFPRFSRLIAAGRLDLAPLMSDPYPMSAINQALDDLEAGRVVRPVIATRAS